MIRMIKMSDLKWFLFCVFSFILLIIGLSSYYNSTHSACLDICRMKHSARVCNTSCYYYYDAGFFAVGVGLMFIGSIIVLISFSVITRRLNNILPDNTK